MDRVRGYRIEADAPATAAFARFRADEQIASLEGSFDVYRTIEDSTSN